MKKKLIKYLVEGIKMKYKMNITITKNGKEETLDLDCNFFIIKENDYGNKHYLIIKDNLGFRQSLDIRYDRAFNVNKKMNYLVDWASYYWSGEGYAWEIKRIEVIKL